MAARLERSDRPRATLQRDCHDYTVARQRLCSRVHARGEGELRVVRVAFDSRPVSDPYGIGRYSRCLLQALRETAASGEEFIETHRPRRADVFHSPWMQGA